MGKLWFRIRVAGLVLLSGLILSGPVPSVHGQASEPEVVISRYKITSSSGQFFELYNNSDQDIDMTSIQLVYYNNYDLSKATSSKLVSLSGVLPARGHYLVNDSAMTMCYQMTIASASLGFSSTAGMVQVIRLHQETIGGPFVSNTLDASAWTRTAVAGVQQLPPASNTAAFLQRVWAEGVPKSSASQSWIQVQPSSSDPCVMESTITRTPVVSSTAYTFLPSTLPPVRYISAPMVTNTITNRNVGKMAPIINELLPNPAPPQTDADNEFVEIYNPNNASFDLTGFKLAYGSTNPRKYTFPEGTILKAKEFKAFTSGNTSISLSNTQAQVWLLDPNEKVVTTIEAYSSAKSGQAWARNGTKWEWTAMPSPNAENTLSPTGSSGSGQTTAAILGINKTASSTPGATLATTTTTPNQLNDASPLHPMVLAGVGAAALGYALYEYRHDIANRNFQLRRYLRARRATRP